MTWSFRLTDFTKLLHALAVLRSEQAQHSLPFLLDSSVHLKRILSSLVPELTTEILVRTRVALGKARQDVIHIRLRTAVSDGLPELELVFLVVLVYQPALENMAFDIVINEMLLVFTPKNFKLNTPPLCELLGVGASIGRIREILACRNSLVKAIRIILQQPLTVFLVVPYFKTANVRM